MKRDLSFQSSHRVMTPSNLLCAAVMALACLPVQAQESTARIYREQAAQYLADAAKHRTHAAELRKDADDMLKRAVDARASAADWRKKGDTILADKQEGEARQHEFHAEQTLNSARSEDERAATSEKDALTRQADAVKAEELSKAPAPVVYREVIALLNNLREELRLSKQGHSWRLGAQYLEAQGVPDWDADAELRDFNQTTLDNLFRPYEDKIRQLEKSILDRRIALDQNKTSANAFFAGVYADMLEGVSSVWEAELTTALNGNYALIAYAYKLERVLRKIYRDTDTALTNSPTPYAVKNAKLAQLAAQQSEARRQMFNMLASRYQIQKNVLKIVRHHWISEMTRWQSLASGFSTDTEDVHAEASRSIAKRMKDLFSSDGLYQRPGSLGPGSVGSFAYVMSPKDYILFPYGGYDWCKARSFPDIQIERCDRLDYYDIVSDNSLAAAPAAQLSLPTAPGDGLPPPELPPSLRSRCEPDYSRALDRAQLIWNDAADARRDSKAHSNEGERARTHARDWRVTAELSRGTAAKARAKGRVADAERLEADTKAYEKQAREADAKAELESQLAKQKEQEAERLEQQAQQMRRKAALDCLRKKS